MPCRRLITFAGRVRDLIAAYYNWIFLPILVVGVVSFLVSALVFWKRAVWNVCFVVAFVSWFLVVERTTLLILIDATSFTALRVNYLSPCYFLLVSGAVLSIAALLQVFDNAVNRTGARDRHEWTTLATKPTDQPIDLGA